MTRPFFPAVTEPMREIKTWALCGVLLVLPAMAAEQALPESIKACARLGRDTERLACYDRAVSDLHAGKPEGAASPENMFGASPSITPAPSPAEEVKRDELKQISAKVVSLKQLDDGALLLTLENDQVWRQQDADARLTVQSGDSVTISRASLGTFRITDTRGRSARFRRVR